MKQNLGISIHFRIIILLLTVGGMIAMALSSYYDIKGTKAENTIEGLNFDSLLNNTFYLDVPFLVDQSSTTGLKPMGIRTTDIATEDFEVTFSGFGVINYDNKTIKHTSNSSGIYVTNPDGSVYQSKGRDTDNANLFTI